MHSPFRKTPEQLANFLSELCLVINIHNKVYNFHSFWNLLPKVSTNDSSNDKNTMFKINISEKTGKTFKLEAEAEELSGKRLHDIIKGEDISPKLKGYELEITGASDNAGFPSLEKVEGIALKKILLIYGKGMKKRPRREGKKKRSTLKPKGLRLRKTIRGNTISPAIVQINMKVVKAGEKQLAEIFPNVKEENKQ